MIGLRLIFTAGRYHATAWDHHVNEGVPEWPPAPWRILRALVAASYRLEEHERGGVAELVEILTAPPVYSLPKASTAHVRHYMPTRSNSVKILDTFVVIGDGAREPGSVKVWWPELDLSDAQRELLGRLAEQISYLGRAESWVEISVIDFVDEEPNARPLTAEDRAHVHTVRLLTAQTGDELASWREAWSSVANQGGRRSGPALPNSVWEALNVDTGQLQRERWSQAPGSSWVTYGLDQRPRVSPRSRKTKPRGPRGVVFLLESAVLPTVDQTLPIAERMRSATMAVSGPPDRRAPWQFSGKDERDRPVEGHGHAYFLPLHQARAGREVIDRMLIWARDGLETDAWVDLQRLATSGRRLGHKQDSRRPALILAAYGDIDQLRSVACVDPLDPRTSWFGPAKRWVSATPFVPPRHTKVRRNEVLDRPEDQLRELITKVLAHRVEGIEALAGDGAFGWNRFVRARKKHRDRPGPRAGWGFRITFSEEVEGPIALGYGAHFGLGLFKPE